MNTNQTHRTSSLLKDLLAMSHIFNGVGSAAGVAIGAIITCWFHQVPINVGSLLAAALSTLLISNGGFIVNDIIDLDIDRINRPDRPLAAGRIPVNWAWAVYVASTVIGVLLGFVAAPPAGLAGLIIAAVLFLYSTALKKRFVVGHLAIGVMGGLLLPFGGLAMGYLLPTLYTFPITFLAFFAREVIKTVPDVEGDRAQGVDNVATRYGPGAALRLGQVILSVCLLLLPGLALVWALNAGFLLIALAIIWPLFFAVLWVVARDDQPRRVQYILRLSKLFFLLVAVALLVGSLR
jgi:geranylgeranylglycerol-phosphate geranylgeranyltransferase